MNNIDGLNNSTYYFKLVPQWRSNQWYKNQTKNELKIIEAQANIQKYYANGLQEASTKYMLILKKQWTKKISPESRDEYYNEMIEAGIFRPRNWWQSLYNPVISPEYKKI